MEAWNGVREVAMVLAVVISRYGLDGCSEVDQYVYVSRYLVRKVRCC